MRGIRQWTLAVGLTWMVGVAQSQITEPYFATDWPTWGRDARRSHFNPNATQSIDTPAVKWVTTGGALDEPMFDGGTLWVPRNGANTRIIEYGFINPINGRLLNIFGPFQGRAVTPAYLNAATLIVDNNGAPLFPPFPHFAIMLSGGQYDCTLFSPSPVLGYPDVFLTLRGLPAYRSGFAAATDGLFIYPILADNFGNILILALLWFVEVNPDTLEVQDVYPYLALAFFGQLDSAVYSIASTSPTLNMVVLGLHKGEIVGFDANLFVFAWSTTIQALSGNEVVSDTFDRPLAITSNESQVIACATNSGRVYSINISNGTSNWEFVAGKPIMAGPSIGPDPSNGGEDTIYIVVRENNTQSAVVAIRAADGTQKWKRVLPNVSRCTPSIDANGVLYLGDDRGVFYSLAPSNGAVRWTTFLSAPIRVAPVIVNVDDATHIYVAGGNRYLFALVDQSTLSLSPSVGVTPLPGGQSGTTRSPGR